MANSFNQDVRQHTGRLKIGEVQDSYNDLKQGHGPYVWRQLSTRKELWFWFLPDENNVFKEFEIVLITEVDKEDSDDIQIIWPAKFKGQDFELTFDLLYKDFEHKNE